MHKPSGPQLAGVLGFFDDPESLMEATAKVRDSNYKHFDCFTPFAIHGLDAAQGLPRSRVPYVTGVFAFTGTALAFLWQYSAHSKWWPHNIGGKPLNSLPAYVPIIFELSILLGGLATFFGMLYFNGLPNLTKRSFDPSITNDRFAILIEPTPESVDDDHPTPPFAPEQAEQFLKTLGAKDVRKVYNEGWFS
ncbi:MAG: DUF3341 domain-containing protein [Bdellovibrionales bacterium]|nr:DUF3341 domain-containing protein [Bdellovibrionales bacterium]